jgi:hypothetical protein
MEASCDALGTHCGEVWKGVIAHIHGNAIMRFVLSSRKKAVLEATTVEELVNGLEKLLGGEVADGHETSDESDNRNPR